MTGFGFVFAAGLAALAAAAAADWAVGVRRPRLTGTAYLLGAAGSACLAVAGGGALAGHAARLPVGGWLGQGAAGLSADRLSGLFLVIAFGAAVPVSLAFANWAARPGAIARRGLGASYALALGATAVFLTAADAFTALLAWELVTVAFYLLAGFERGRPGRPGGAFVTLAFGKVSGAALLAGLLVAAASSGSLSLAAFGHMGGGAARDAAQTLLTLGFAVKVGLVPFQLWLPRGYAAAPGPARAIMAGVAVNVGFYGLWRTLALLGAPPDWLIGLLLVLAAVTALLGIAHAAVQPGLQRVIAYSSVENSGLILAGYGVALTGTAVGDQRLAAAGLLAATLQIVAHTAAKSLLFTASAALAPPGGAGRESPGDDDLDTLRGSARRAPWSGAGLAIGSLTLAGLPLTAGFVSEWFLLEALMQQYRVPGLALRLTLAVAGAGIALTAGFAAVTFVRITGLVVLGPPPAPQPSAGPAGPPAREYGWLGRAAIVVLASGCLVTAALAPLVIRALAAGLTPAVPRSVTLGALKSPWVLQPVFDGFSILSPSWLWLAMPALMLAIAAFAAAVSGKRMTRVRRVPAWRSATAGVEGTDSYTATGFANPARRVLATVVHTRSQVRPLADSPSEPGAPRAGDSLGGGAGGGGRAAENAGALAPAGPRLGYTSDVIEVVEAYVYRPLVRPAAALVRAAKRLQSGRLDAYLAYMLIALVALIALAVAFA